MVYDGQDNFDGHGLWRHVTQDKYLKQTIQQDDMEIILVEEGKWFHKDRQVLSIIQNSLEGQILEAYSYFETTKTLWETLTKVYRNTTNLGWNFEARPSMISAKKIWSSPNTLTSLDLYGLSFEMLRSSSVDVFIERHK